MNADRLNVIGTKILLSLEDGIVPSPELGNVKFSTEFDRTGQLTENRMLDVAYVHGLENKLDAKQILNNLDTLETPQDILRWQRNIGLLECPASA